MPNSTPHSMSRLDLIRERLAMNPADPNGPAWQAAYMFDVKYLVEQYEVLKQRLVEVETEDIAHRLEIRDTELERLHGIEEQFEALRDAAERVVGADNQSLGATGEEGHRAQVEIIDALHALRVLLLDSNPAKEPS